MIINSITNFSQINFAHSLISKNLNKQENGTAITQSDSFTRTPILQNPTKHNKLTSLQVKELKKQIQPFIDKNDTYGLLKYLNYNCKKQEDGKIILEEYRQPAHTSFTTLGLDENWILNDVIEIKGTAYFKRSNATELKNLERIGGSLFLGKNTLKTDKLKFVGKDVMLTPSTLDYYLPRNAKLCGSYIHMRNAITHRNPNEKRISKDECEKLLSEGDRREIFLKSAKIKSDILAGNKLLINGYRQPGKKIKYKDLGINEDELLKTVSVIERNNADFKNSDATIAQDLVLVRKYLDLRDSKIEKLPKLKYVDKGIILNSNSKMKSEDFAHVMTTYKTPCEIIIEE